MNLIVETDIGHDPDDLFALCYLIAAGVNIKALLVHPGDPDQIAITKYICEVAGIKIPIGFDKFNRIKNSSGSIHHQLLGKRMEHLNKWGIGDGYSDDILNDEIREDTEFFVCGPVTTIGNYLENYPSSIKKATMQGGFLSYSAYNPKNKIEKFVGKYSMQTFNLNGDIKAGKKFLSANIQRRQMVGKNLCHSIIFQQDHLDRINPKCDTSKLFKRAAELYFTKHSNKKFHDPTAACLHLHPEIGEWFRGRTVRLNTSSGWGEKLAKSEKYDDYLEYISLNQDIRSDGWGTIPDPNGDYIAANIDEDKLWDHLFNFN